MSATVVASEESSGSISVTVISSVFVIVPVLVVATVLLFVGTPLDKLAIVLLSVVSVSVFVTTPVLTY